MRTVRLLARAIDEEIATGRSAPPLPAWSPCHRKRLVLLRSYSLASDALEEYLGSMKEKTSITLSKDVLAKVDRLAGSKQSRSAFIERVLRTYLRERSRAALNARDLERINRAADRLNLEAAKVLEYQAPDSQATSEEQ